MTTRRAEPATPSERRARGKEARAQTPRSSHEGWTASAERPDPVALLEQQNTTREPDLVPVRHGRMMVSPFTFYRGALLRRPPRGRRRRGRHHVEQPQ